MGTRHIPYTLYPSNIQVPNLGVTLFDSYSYDGVSAGKWVIHTVVANLGVTLFDSYSYDGVSAGIWVIHTYGSQIWVQDGDGI